VRFKIPDKVRFVVRRPPVHRLCPFSRYLACVIVVAMNNPGFGGRLALRVVDGLYVEAMVLADEARAYFDRPGSADRDSLPPLLRVSFSCESLKITTRLMHIVAWILTRRAIEAGEMAPGSVRDHARRLGRADDSDPAVFAALPETARILIQTSRELYRRVERLDVEHDSFDVVPSPARGLLSRLESAF
jgi:regulator of CtrA degradation